MKNSNNSYLNILDLPDEILFIILNKLKMIDVFYSLMDINQRFRRLVLDSLYIRHLDMTNTININSEYNQCALIDTEVFAQICSNVLPRIDHQVYEITIEEDLLKGILAANYPQLYSLTILNCHEQLLYQNLTGRIFYPFSIIKRNCFILIKDNLLLRDLLGNQITHLNIDLNNPRTICSKTVANIFGLILSLCKQLIVLNFGDMFIRRKCQIPVYYLRNELNMSSTLMKLKINVVNFADCIFLLDGRFECLSK
jgi:hypothetical protein